MAIGTKRRPPKLLRAIGAGRELRGRSVQSGGHRRRHRQQHLSTLGRHQKPDQGRKPRGAVVLARQPDGDTNGKHKAQVREDRITGSRQNRDTEQIRLTQSQQQARHRQHRDRQHQRAA